MKSLNIRECIDRITAIKKKWKKSLIEIESYQQWASQCYRVIKFKYKGVNYEYREDASDSWIDFA